MDNRNQIRDFLTSRRGKTPAYVRNGRHAAHRLVMDLRADPGLSLIVYSAEPGSGSQDALKLLASWTADEEEPTAAAAIDQLP